MGREENIWEDWRGAREMRMALTEIVNERKI